MDANDSRIGASRHPPIADALNHPHDQARATQSEALLVVSLFESWWHTVDSQLWFVGGEPGLTLRVSAAGVDSLGGRHA